MNFTVKEAKHLQEHHQILLHKLEQVIALETGLHSAIRISANNLIMQSIPKKLIQEDHATPSDFPKRLPSVERLVFNLHKYQKAYPAIQTAKSYYSSYVTSIKQNIKLLNPGLAGLSWFFGGKRVKESAEQAFRELTDLSSGSYGQIVPFIASDIEALQSITNDTAWEQFICDPIPYAETLTTLCPDILESTSDNPFQTQLLQLTSIDKKINNCQSITDKEQEQIKLSAEKLKAFNAMQILKEVPVEEINREKSGYRIKSLRDAGITTMADIYASSIYELSSLNGISDQAAFAIKRMAHQFLMNAQEDVKIKLSADDRNKASTELVKSIYIYRLKNNSRNELNKLIQEKKDILKTAKENLKSLGNGLPWLFYSPEQRTDVRNSYSEITSVTEGEYARTITQLTNILSKNNALSPSSAEVWNDFREHSIEYISILEEIVPGVLGNDDILYGLPEDLAREIQEEVLFPDGLLCTLRRYQEWGVKYILHQKKALLGDEMGLGKTVQAIATMVSLKNVGASHFIVICPASVVTNWCREVTKHSRLRVTKIHGSGRNQALKSWVKTGGVAVTTFETTAYIKDESIEKINLLIVDEAHYIKNPEARRSINVKRLCGKAERLLFMTGTALENNVEEMISLIDVLQPDIATSVQGMTFMPNAPQFRNRIAPVYYRRKRQDVLTELPELIETKEWCILHSDEQKLYEDNILSKNHMAARRLSWDADDLKKSCKAIRLLEIIEQAKSEDRKVLVFSFFLETIRVIGGLLGAKCYGPINGSIPPPRRQEIIDSFDKAPSGSVLLAQIQSGGTGLNIQSASVIVICEPQFKPSIENQAISRAYRMGQARNVLVHRLLCVNSIDEKITELLEYKQKIFDEFADKSVAAEKSEVYNEEIDEKKFGQLIQEEIDRINAEKARSQSSSDTPHESEENSLKTP